MDWIALKHALLSHLPVAAGLLLAWPLLSAQRAGRGIRPWWTVARYLGWAGLLGTLASVVSGLAAGHALGLMSGRHILPVPASGSGTEGLLFRHALLGGVSLVVGCVTMWAMSRPRKDHQSLGLLTLALGLGWSALLLLSGEGGYRLAHGRGAMAAAPASAPVVALVVAPATVPSMPLKELDVEAKAPVRALDYASLEAIHTDPVKSLAHGGRWIRAWANPETAAAYRKGQPLPPGALVVLSSMEDRYGRPGAEGGPLYALEMKASGPALTFYWARIPMERRRDFGGESRVYWRDQDSHLESCRACHAEGMADPQKRSHWRPKRVVETSN